MEYLSLGIVIGFIAGVWVTVILINLKRQAHGEAPTRMTEAITKPFTKSKKLKPKVNDDMRAWKLENNREA